jgi:PhzF family phenazine biosynthesis protein
MTLEILRLAAFPVDGRGGNPAGVVLQAEGLTDAEMQTIAGNVGYSETAFITEQKGNRLRVRYFSPEMEVDFCGHATIAAGVALGESAGAGNYIFETNSGDVGVAVTGTTNGFQAELSSSRGQISPLDDALLTRLFEILRWSKSELDEEFPPMISDAGNAHPVLVLKSVDTLQSLDYDFEDLKALCREHRWPTLQLVAREAPSVWQSRNPFAFGGVYEDPATGSAAAAFGVYLREIGKVQPGDKFEIKQGFAMGQPCLLTVTVGKDDCKVSGAAIQIA